MGYLVPNPAVPPAPSIALLLADVGHQQGERIFTADLRLGNFLAQKL